MHWEPYRATLEELKIAGDMFLLAGANKFVNSGFIASPERDIAPSRGFYAAIHISPDNVWWPYYHFLSDYVARCCYLLRQGEFFSRRGGLLAAREPMDPRCLQCPSLDARL